MLPRCSEKTIPYIAEEAEGFGKLSLRKIWIGCGFRAGFDGHCGRRCDPLSPLQTAATKAPHAKLKAAIEHSRQPYNAGECTWLRTHLSVGPPAFSTAREVSASLVASRDGLAL
jgi:hypothetical protein